MFAIVQAGNRHYKVKANDLIAIEEIEVKEGEQIELTEVLMVGEEHKVKSGTPYIKGAAVVAKVENQKDPKHTHTNPQTFLRILEIHASRATMSTNTAKASDKSEKPNTNHKSPSYAKSNMADKAEKANVNQTGQASAKSHRTDKAHKVERTSDLPKPKKDKRPKLSLKNASKNHT